MKSLGEFDAWWAQDADKFPPFAMAVAQVAWNASRAALLADGPEATGGGMKVYYAHSIALYNTKQEVRDVALLNALGFDVVNPNATEHDEGYKRMGMAYFEAMIRDCDALAFKANPDGTINAGIAKEIADAKAEPQMPVFELPSGIDRRSLTVDQTRAYLRDQGVR